MSNASVNDNRQEPAGTIPKRIQTLVLVLISGLIVTTGFCSRVRAPKPKENSTAGQPAPSDLATVDEIRRRLERLTPGEPIPAVPQPMTITPDVPRESLVAREPQVDPATLDELRRADRARFARPLVYSKGAREPANAPPLSSERQPPQEAETKEPVLRESGQMRPVLPGTHWIQEGALLEAVLENRLDGTFSGPVLCRITTPVYSGDGVTLLIPEGARLIGSARQVDGYGQRRLLVEFHRLIFPNKYSVDLLNVPALNHVGETGLKDKVDNHYLRQLGISGLVGLFSGLSLQGVHAGTNATGGDVYRERVSSGLGNSATDILNRYSNILPTITIREGQLIKVFLTQDLLLPPYRS